tara:strand:+ start:63 stop:1754 length:1692 start_codon:yes stop_codon:yes gene_type:complete
MIISSKVLALKYRPQNFNEVVGQEIIVKTIYNSIKENKIPNAFLFTGIRGTGKTTLARLIAKSLNCVNGIDKVCENKYCEHCEAISNSNHLDILEMDAASKTGVDDVRDLIEFSRYAPNSAKYKIFIIDEVHMLSKQAFNALLKTLEEPPEYLKFIFCTTEIKKIPVTVISRTQRFDLSRVKSKELFDYIKHIKDKENGNVSDDAIKLIVKISEGSVRDALSLLDRGLISNPDGSLLDLNAAQKIFGYFDKSFLIDLFEKIFEGDEQAVINIYRSIYDSGVEPKIFLNDFLEVLYYIKNIAFIKIEGTNFSLNDKEFNKIEEISKKINRETLLLFWQYTIKAFDELEMVTNQDMSLEMFLIRLLYLKKINYKNEKNDSTNINMSQMDNNESANNNLSYEKNKNNLPYDDINFKNKTISQIKNLTQKELLEKNSLTKETNKFLEISSYDELIEICNKKKEVRLKYELENNVNLVSFENKRIEISFNDNLDKEFVKNLSAKLYEWTSLRWIIAFSQNKGELSKKQAKQLSKAQMLDETKKSKIYKKIKEKFYDAELIDIKEIDEE